MAGRRPTYSSNSCALSVTVRSSLPTHGGRKIEPSSPAFMRACWPTITFSSALIVANMRMFWNVRDIPIARILSGRPRVTSLPSNTILPVVGLYRPVSMLKNVVLPAPLGPMIETIPLRGMEKLTSETATSPPKTLLTSSALRIWSVSCSVVAGSGTVVPAPSLTP